MAASTHSALKDADFVNKWESKEEPDLIEEALDTFYDDADLEHGFGMYSDSNLTAYEIKDGEEVEIEEDIPVSCLMSREAYITDSETWLSSSNDFSQCRER